MMVEKLIACGFKLHNDAVFVSTFISGQVEKTVWLWVREDNPIGTADNSEIPGIDDESSPASDDG